MVEIPTLFNPATSYYVNDRVIHDGVFYKFTADHTGAWTGNDVVRRPELDVFFSDFMDTLTDYGCGNYTKVEFRKLLEDLHDRYKYYPTTEIMYKATIQRLTSCGRASKEKDTNCQCKWVNQELDLVKCPPKIIF